jgi:diacylglycerol kinase family enzyme
MLPASLVVLNPAARGGAARQRWRDVRAEVARYSRPALVHTDPEGRWVQRVRLALGDGVRFFVAAGGDGTVNALANALLSSELELGSGATLGAIGLGSSNDFHKPNRCRAPRIPLRIDPRRCTQRDVGIARYRDAAGVERTRCFVVSASVGFTAEANAAFNDRALVPLKRRSASAAIAYAALRTIARQRSFSAELRVADDEPRALRLSNLSIMKTPHLSGWMRFDTPVASDDGHFAVNAFEELGGLGALRALWNLSRGRFLGCSGTHHWRASSLSVTVPHAVALELDGEVVEATHIGFDVLPRRLRCCT